MLGSNQRLLLVSSLRHVLAHSGASGRSAYLWGFSAHGRRSGVRCVLTCTGPVAVRLQYSHSSRRGSLICLFRVISQVLQRFAFPLYLSHFLCSSVTHVAPYCVPGGVRVVSIGIRNSGAPTFSCGLSSFPLRYSRRSIPPCDRFELRFGSTSLTSVLMLKAAKRYASMTMYSSPEVSESRQFSSSWFATTITGSANCFLLPLHVAQKLPSRLRKWISTLQRWSIHADHKVQGSTPIPPPLA